MVCSFRAVLAAVCRVQVGGLALFPTILNAVFQPPPALCAAAAYYHLGEHDQARRYYGEAVQWMQQHPEAYSDLHLFRMEAARVLGIP